MSTLVGSYLGQYRILREIGRGGMAVVYLAEQPSLGRYVALKVLHPYLADDATFVARFQREARTAARLQHSNIVTIYEVGQQGGYYFIAMEYLAGQPLNELIRRQGALPLPRVVHIVQQVATALDCAHSQGFVHRDIKPSNIIVGQGDSVKLTDFGIAKSRLDARLTVSGHLLGTPYYMSPEQAQGRAVDYRADIYSLGVVCYEMLTGRVPFGGETPVVLHKHVYERARPATELNRRLPPAVSAAVERALAKQPGGRYRGAGEFARSLAAGAGQPVAVPPPSRTWDRGRLEPRWFAAGAAIALLFIVMVLVMFTRRPIGPEPPFSTVVTRTPTIQVGIVTSTPTRWAITPTPSRTPTPRPAVVRCFQPELRHKEAHEGSSGEVAGVVSDLSGRPYPWARVHISVESGNWEGYFDVAPDGLYNVTALSPWDNIYLVRLVGGSISSGTYRFQYTADPSQWRVLIDFREVPCGR